MLFAAGYDWPMGTDRERRGLAIPPGMWHVGNPFGNFYYLGPGATNPAYHTGADTTIESGGGLGQPIHACATGTIVFARRIPNSSWGNVIVQHCQAADGREVYIRYGHSDPMFVGAGDTVVRGQILALESNAFGRFYPHLHLDFSLTSVLRDHPADWPGLDTVRLNRDYTDPVSFIRNNRPMATIAQVSLLLSQAQALLSELETPPPPPPVVLLKYVNVTVGAISINARSSPSINGTIVGTLPRGTEVHVIATADPQWLQLADGPYKASYLFAALLSDTRP